MTEPDPPPDEESPPADTFALVGHHIRAEIIQVLDPLEELSLSEMRSRLDTDVEPSQLHYHLQQLVGHFVEKTDDGYHLSGVGTRLSWTLRSGELDRQEERVTVDANFECYNCQTQIEAVFHKGSVRMECPDCEHLYLGDYYILSLDAFEDEEGAFLHFSQYVTLKMLFLSHNVCPSCTNHLCPTFHSTEKVPNRKVVIDKSCKQCGAPWEQSVGTSLLADPVLLSLCYDHGVNVLSTPWWELEFAATDKHVTIRSTDPWEVALAVTFDDDTLELVVDDELNVLERNWLDLAGGGEIAMPDESDCLKMLRQQRWPDGVKCPHCSSGETVKTGTTSKDAQRYRCETCDRIFNDLTGTVFAERRLSLPEMVHIIRNMDEETTAGMARDLDRTYKSVLDFVHLVQDVPAQASTFDFSDLFEPDGVSATGDDGK